MSGARPGVGRFCRCLPADGGGLRLLRWRHGLLTASILDIPALRPLADNGEWALAAGKPSPALVDRIFNRDGDAIASEAVAGSALPTTPFPADTGEAPETNTSVVPGMTSTPLPILVSDRGFRPVGECWAGLASREQGTGSRPSCCGGCIAGDTLFMLTRYYLPATLSGGASGGSGDDFGSPGGGAYASFSPIPSRKQAAIPLDESGVASLQV